MKNKPLAISMLLMLLISITSIAVLIPRMVVAHPSSTDSIVGLWHLDEGIGTTAYDSSGYGNDGTIQGNPAWVSGRIGKALKFDGIDDYVEVPDSASLDITDKITVEAWVKIDVSGTDMIIVRKGLAYSLQKYTDDKFEFWVCIGGTWRGVRGVAGGTVAATGTWYHVAGVYDGSYVKVYVNNVLDRQAPVTGTIDVTNRPLGIGVNTDTTTYKSFFNGIIDEVYVWSTTPPSPPPATVWVDDDFDSSILGWNVYRFNKIQDGVDAVAEGGTVHVYPGEYTEQVIVNKNLSLEGMSGAKIVAPDTRSTFTIPESTATWDPIIFAYGSLSGSETISVTVDGFEIDGGNKASSSYRYVGILCRNVKPGTISNNVVHSLYPPSGKGSGPQTFGIMVYGDSEMTISHNEVRDFSRGGIGVSGDAGSNPDPYALIQQNTVFGNGLETETGWWAENGIQVGYGATAHVVGNHVYDCTVNNPSWSATGIMAVDTDGVTIESNYVEGCDLGIAAVDFPESKYGSFYHLILSNVDIIGNTLVGNTWQVDISNDARNITLICNNILNAIEDGIDVWSYSGVTVYPTNVKINYNNIVGSGTYGLWVEDDVLEQVDARYNWWGNASGPYHPTLNPGGTGDELYGNANFSPWLLAEKVPPLVHDVAVINVVASPSRVVVGTAVQVSVTVKNEGNTYETFDVSLYYDNHFISKQTITDMIPGSTKILVFTWDTTGVTPYGDYAIKAEADAVPGETDLADNIKTITVRIGEKPTLNVEPPTYNAKLLGETFTVNITINDLGAYWRLVGLEFRIAYNSTLLRVVNVTEGPFLKDPRWNHHGTFFIYFIERATVLPNGTIIPSHVLIGTLLLPNATGYWEEFPHGEGVVASITFEVIYQDRGYDKKLGYIIPPIASNFALFGSRVIDDDGLLIPHDAEGWQCTIYPTNIADVNYDGYVGIDDIFIISSAFGEEPGRPRWNPDLDLNKDNYIGIDDIYIAASNFGWEPDP